MIPLGILSYFIDILLKVIGLGAIVKFLYDLAADYRNSRRIEKSYSQALKFIRDNLEEVSFVLGKLPDEIVVETASRGGRRISSKL